MRNSGCSDQFADLCSRLYLLTRSGKYWGKDGAIKVARHLFNERKRNGDGTIALSSLSSTYYSASENATAHALIRSHGNVFGFMFLAMPWHFRSFLCLNKAEKISDQLVNKLGIGCMGHDVLDLRSTILNKAGRHLEALDCVQEALSRKPISPDSQVLLETGLAEIKNQLGKPTDAKSAYERAHGLITSTKPTTAVRYYTSWAEYKRSWGDDSANDLLEKALLIARANGLDDQVFKIHSLKVYSS